MKCKISILILSMILLCNTASASFNPILSEKNVYGVCESIEGNEISLEGTIVSLPDDMISDVQIGNAYEYTKINLLFGEDKVYFGEI